MDPALPDTAGPKLTLKVLTRTRTSRSWLFVAAALLGVLALPLPAQAATAPDKPPAGWPKTMEVGLRDDEGGAAALAETAPGVRLRYHYLSGDVLRKRNKHWSEYATGNGAFVSQYIEDSRAHDQIPVFSMYSLMESTPGHGQPDEADWARLNLAAPATMKAWFEGLELFFERSAGKGLVVLHLEPDMWGYSHRRATDDDASTVPAAVASSGFAGADGMPNTLSGVARTIVELRDALAPNVALGYQMSVWGTGVDPAYSDDADDEVDRIAARAAAFYSSLDADFDLIFHEFSDRDASYRQLVDMEPRALWDGADYARHARYIRSVSNLTRRRGVIWQIPLGNSVMRAMDNTRGHYQDNRVQTLFADALGNRLQAYVNAGVVGLLFGDALPDATCACDKPRVSRSGGGAAVADGITNPNPVNGNSRKSLSADDDGGYFREQVGRYVERGRLVLPSGRVAAPGSPGSSDLVGTDRVAFRGRLVGPTSALRRGGRWDVRLAVKSTAPATVIATLQTRRGTSGSFKNAGSPVRLKLSAGSERSFTVRWKIPSSAKAGGYTTRIVIRERTSRSRPLAVLPLKRSLRVR